MTPAADPPSGLAAAVAAYNRASAELDIARRLLHREMAADDAVRPPRRTHPPCGTRGAYARHIRRGEVADPACCEAHARDGRQRGRRTAA